jgi:hypothetical protein
MPDPDSQPTKTAKVFGIPAKVFAVLAIVGGTISCAQRAVRGHSASYEDIMVFAVPAVVAALIAIAAERSALTFVAVGFALLGVIGVFLG